jgi:hypothetical protein
VILIDRVAIGAACTVFAALALIAGPIDMEVLNLTLGSVGRFAVLFVVLPLWGVARLADWALGGPKRRKSMRAAPR